MTGIQHSLENNLLTFLKIVIKLDVYLIQLLFFFSKYKKSHLYIIKLYSLVVCYENLFLCSSFRCGREKMCL